MGCWNKTCGLSNLHITAGTDVYVFLLEQNERDDDRCYSTAFFSPLLLPFTAKYDDYGGGEDCGGFVSIVINGVREKLIEVEQGPNEFHDIAVKRVGFGEQELFRSCLESRLKTRGSEHERLVDFVMFRKDIVDGILDNYVVEKYVGHGKGTTGYENSYITYKFQDVINDVPDFITELMSKIALKRANNGWWLGGLYSIFEWNGPNKAAWFLADNNYRYSRIVDVGDEIVNLIDTDDRHIAEELLTEYLKGLFLDMFMNRIRKNWMPGGHEGSQEQERKGHRVLLQVIGQALDIEENEEREYCEEDE